MTKDCFIAYLLATVMLSCYDCPYRIASAADTIGTIGVTDIKDTNGVSWFCL